MHYLQLVWSAQVKLHDNWWGSYLLSVNCSHYWSCTVLFGFSQVIFLCKPCSVLMTLKDPSPVYLLGLSHLPTPTQILILAPNHSTFLNLLQTFYRAFYFLQVCMISKTCWTSNANGKRSASRKGKSNLNPFITNRNEPIPGKDWADTVSGEVPEKCLGN